MQWRPWEPALTSGHASLVKRYTQEVLLLYDSDEAGVRGRLASNSHSPGSRREFQSGESDGLIRTLMNLSRAEGAEAFEKRLEAGIRTALCSG
ncbi:MAG: hypothetical protein ACLURP_03100 [Ruminococcus sp.]